MSATSVFELELELPNQELCARERTLLGFDTVAEAVAGGMIDYDALNRKIGSLRDASNQARRQKAERTEILVPERVAMKWIKNFPNG